MIDKLKFSSKKKNSVLSLVLIVVLLTMVFLPIQESAAAPITDTPVGVNGRILPASLAGDTSDWIEIARNGDYSLIVRANYIKIGRNSNPSYPYSPAQPNIYSTSNVRTYINKWFNNLLTPIVAGNAYDSLPDNARLRDFTVQNNAATVVGTSYQVNSYTDGFSKPTNYQLRYGNDVAFALSYSEVIAYLSLYDYKSGPILTHSNNIAKANFKQLGVSDGYIYLRSTPYSNWARPALIMNPNIATYAGVTEVMFDGYFVPALWVGSGVFEPVPTSYDITYVLNGGINAASNPASYAVSALPLSIANPSRLGYTFSHWRVTCINGTEIVLPASGIPAGTTGNVTLTAIWGAPIQYAITYNLNGGAPAAGNPTTYNIENSFTINSNSVVAPSMTGYKFMNWRAIYSNGTMFNLTPAGIPAGSTGDVLLAAIWDPIPIYYNIVYVLDGGVNAPGNPSVYTVASTFPIDIGNPSRPNYTFLGWVVVYNNGTVIPLASSYSIPTGSAGNVTLTAVWSPIIQTFSIEYNLNGGVNAVGNPTSYSTNSLPLSIANPSRSGYVFSYWLMECEGSFTALTSGVIPAGTVGNVRLTAVWTVAPTYTITYALNGGTNAVGNPTTYTTSSAPLNVADPSMSGYVFLYWIALYADGSLGVLPPSGIAAGTTGDITLIAVWYP